MAVIVLVGNNFSGDILATGNIAAVGRISGRQLANGEEVEGGIAIPITNTIEWVAFNPSVEGLNRARGSLAIETDTNPPVVWLKTTPGGGSPYGWVALSAGGSGPSTSVQWTAPAAIDMPAGTPVQLKDGQVGPAQATTSVADATVVGVLVADVLASATATVQSQGPLTLTTAQWDAVTGGSGGLAANVTYYLSTTPGELKDTAPSSAGDYVTSVMQQLSATTAVIMPQAPIGPL